jgi:UV excision repair protein RAD23
MKLTVKSLKQIPYDVEVSSEQSTVLELKQAIEAAHNFDHASLKLVFNGVVLDNAKTLAELNIKEGSVIVMMTSKAKPVNVPKEEAKKEEKPTTNTTSSTTGTTSNTTTTNTQQAQRDYSAQVKDLMDMGFPKAESEAAIKAAQGDISIAIEFLYNGIPENLPTNLGTGSSGEQGTVSSALKSISSIVKILCQNDPSQLQNILLTLQQTSPEIIQLIRENEEEFKNLLQQPVTEEDMQAFQQFNSQAGLGGQGQGQGSGTSSSSGSRSGTGQGGRGREVLRLSQEDYNAVAILKEYGFSEMDAAQAYFACDKNIEQAANLLWENKLKENEQPYEIDCKI